MKKSIKIQSKSYPELELKVIPGHFMSEKFHQNYYIDMSALKMRQTEAKIVAHVMAEKYIEKLDVDDKLSSLVEPSLLNMAISSKKIDTIICLDGCEIIGAYLAEELRNVGVLTSNEHGCFNIISPEFDHTGGMIINDSIKNMIIDKNVLIVSGCAITGHTIEKIIQTICTFHGYITGVSVIFGNIETVLDYHVYQVFSKKDFPDFMLFSPDQCEICKAGVKVDGFIYSYGFEEIS